MNLRGTFYFKDHHYESLFLSIDSLSCATDSLDLCILFKFIFLYLPIQSASFLRFSLILRVLLICILPCGIFFLIPDDAVDWRKLGI